MFSMSEILRLISKRLVKHIARKKERSLYMTGYIVKLIVCPIMVIIAGMVFPNVNFANLFQPIMLGILLATVGYLMELMILNRKTIGLSTVADLAASTLFLYFFAMFFRGAVVTFFGAFLTAVLLGVTEYVQHRWLVKSGKTDTWFMNKRRT